MCFFSRYNFSCNLERIGALMLQESETGSLTVLSKDLKNCEQKVKDI